MSAAPRPNRRTTERAEHLQAAAQAAHAARAAVRTAAVDAVDDGYGKAWTAQHARISRTTLDAWLDDR